MKKYLLIPLLGLLVGCVGGGGGSSNPTPTPKPTPTSINFIPTSQFGVYNNCSYTIWLQAQNQPNADNPLVKIMPQQSYSYAVNGQPLSAFSVIPKSGCDSSGNNCNVGQSQPPCPPSAAGCQPPIDSLFEATFNSPSGTFFDVSAVNGFTLPYDIQVAQGSDETNPTCTNSWAFNLNPHNCPTNEDLSTPANEMTVYAPYNTFGPFPALINQNLQVRNPNSGEIIGCAAPYEKLIMPTAWGGLNIAANGYNPDLYDQVIMYACQPISSQLIHSVDNGIPPGNNSFYQLSDYCNSSKGPCYGTTDNPNGPQATDTFKVGPITKTQWVNYIHNNTTNVYAWQYDDVEGTHVCSSKQSKIAFVLCP